MRPSPAATAAACDVAPDRLGTPLFATTFVVLDLETTGPRPGADRITEVGAVKVRGGEVLGELQTLVRPDRSIPSAVTAVTGITDAMVRDAPAIEAVLPTVLEFLGDAVLVAHNATFDVAFVRAEADRLGHGAFTPVVVDTARLARRLLDGEVRDRRLATVARHLRSRTVPDHRALTDARATVDVLHGLLERAGPYGATTLEDLRDLCSSTSDRAYRRIGLVRDAPRAAGVYRFLDARGEVLYVGRATDLRSRLRAYFGQDPRRRVADLVRETQEVCWTTTPTLLEAEVAEVRAIHAHAPRYNRRSRRPGPGVHVALTDERFPRLSIVSRPRPAHARTIGPIASRRSAELLIDAIHHVVPLRTCSVRLRRAQDHPACVLKDLGRCGAPCDGTQDATAYAEVVTRLHAILDDPSLLLDGLRVGMLELAATGRFERAGELRQRLHGVARLLEELRRLAALAEVGRLVAARRVQADDLGRVEVVVVERGRLAATASADDPGGPLHRAAAPLVPRPGPSAPSAEPSDAEERRLVHAWLDRSGVVLLEATSGWSQPLPGGRALATAGREARRVDRQIRRDRQLLRGDKVTWRPPVGA